jgi:hypothetical protein
VPYGVKNNMKTLNLRTSPRFNSSGLGGTFFNLRKFYLSRVVPLEKYDNFFNSPDLYLYGKVDLDGNIVYPSEKYLSRLVNPDKKSANTYYALNFVASAFSDFREFYIKHITPIDTGVADAASLIQPVKGWQSMHDLYATNINNLYSVVINDFIERPYSLIGKDARPTNFDQFMKSLNKLFISFGFTPKMSRSSFIMSMDCPLSVTGLSIEIGPEFDYSNDVLKETSVYDNPNFDFYMKSLKKFGFMVDVDYPGRIIADIGSPVMQEYMLQYDITIDNLFEKYYYKAGDYDYDLVKSYLFQFYNSYVDSYPRKTTVTKAGSVGLKHNHHLVSKKNKENRGVAPYSTNFVKLKREKTIYEFVTRNKLDIGELDNSPQWITAYIHIMNYELKNILNKHDLKRIVKNAQDLNKNLDIETAKSYINRIFTKLRYPQTKNVITSKPGKTVDVLEQGAYAETPVATISNGGSSGGSSGGGGY